MIISKEQILEIHRYVIERFGGLDGIRDEGLLDSQCDMPYQTFGGIDLFPTIYDKAVRYLVGFATNQIFLDGNKRTAAMTMMVYLRISGIEIQITSEELASITLDIANGKLSDAYVKDLLIERTK